LYIEQLQDTEDEEEDEDKANDDAVQTVRSDVRVDTEGSAVVIAR